MSLATARPLGATRCARACAIDPLPLPSSRQRQPGRTPSQENRASSIGSNSSDISANRARSPANAWGKVYSVIGITLQSGCNGSARALYDKACAGKSTGWLLCDMRTGTGALAPARLRLGLTLGRARLDGRNLDIGLDSGFHPVPVNDLAGDLHPLVLKILELLGLTAVTHLNRADGFPVDDGLGIDLHHPTSGFCSDSHRAMDRSYQRYLLRIVLVRTQPDATQQQDQANTCSCDAHGTPLLRPKEDFTYS